MKKIKNNIVDQPIDLSKHIIKDGPKFLSHRIIVKDNISYLKPTISSMIFCFIYILIGLFLIFLSGLVYYNNKQWDLVIFMGAIGTAITTFGLTLVRPFLHRASFDKTKDIFANDNDRCVKLSSIVSLQINNKMVKRKQGLHYQCYELNLITKSGRRINILNHNGLEQLINDAKSLSQFLAIELIDARRDIKIEA